MNRIIKTPPKKSIAMLHLLMSTAEAIGFDPFMVLRMQPVSVDRMPKGMDAPTQQLIPLYRAWMERIRRMRYEDFRSITPTASTSELLSYSVIGCENLSEVVSNIARHIESSRWSEFTLSDQGNNVVLRFKTETCPENMIFFIWDFFGLCFLQKLFSWLIGEPLFNLRIGIAHKNLVDAELVEAIVGCPINFEQGTHNSLSFHKHMLSRRVIKTYRELRETLQAMPLELLPTPCPRHLSEKLEAIINDSLENRKAVPTAEQIAILIGSSGPTLRRRVAREGSSFQQLVEKCRREKAIELLNNYRMTIENIADQLGFSTASGFSRAFKEWTGLAPSEYRNTYSFAVDQR